MSFRQKLNAAKAKRQVLLDSLKSSNTKIAEWKDEKTTIIESQTIIQKVARETQEQIRYSIEDIVQVALDAVFPMMYTFKLIFETKRNKTEARIALMEGENEIDPLDNTGGGLADVLETVLRIATLIISGNRRTLILDEPGKFVSVDLRDLYYEILKKLSSEVGIQVIMVTHDPACVAIADKVYTVQKIGGISQVH